MERIFHYVMWIEIQSNYEIEIPFSVSKPKIRFRSVISLFSEQHTVNESTSVRYLSKKRKNLTVMATIYNIKSFGRKIVQKL
jgi:hypothetical protein